MELKTSQPIVLKAASNSSDRKAMTVWIDAKCKEKYDDVQKMSGGEACETLRSIIEQAITSFEIVKS